MTVTVTIRDRSQKKLKLAEKKIFSQSERTAKEIADLGKYYAKSIAPTNSGYLLRLIKTLKGNKDFEYTIVSQNPKSNRLWPGSGKYKDFNLVQWMHQTGGVFKTDNPFGKAGTKHIKSGDPKYMYTTLRYLKAVADIKARKYFKRIKIR